MRSTGDLHKKFGGTTGSNFYNTVSTKSSASLKLKHRKNWNERIGLPISTYNEDVFPKFKILFEHL